MPEQESRRSLGTVLEAAVAPSGFRAVFRTCRVAGVFARQSDREVRQYARRLPLSHGLPAFDINKAQMRLQGCGFVAVANKNDVPITVLYAGKLDYAVAEVAHGGSGRPSIVDALVGSPLL